MKSGNIFVSELSTSSHVFQIYHFCRGNSNRRKTRIGIIRKGSGDYIYLNKKLSVTEGDAVFIPENIYCYSEWRGDPDIEVVYISCFMHYNGLRYEPQIIACDRETKEALMTVSRKLNGELSEELEAYSMFYKILQGILPQMIRSDISIDKTVQTAMEYMTDHPNDNFSVADLARICCVSESTLYHLFQKELGQTPVKFLNSIRINISIDYLENTNYSISTISRMVGFNSENHFRKVFTDQTGTTPLKFRKNRYGV